MLFLAGLRRIGATRTAVLSLSESLAATLLAAVMLGQLPTPAQLLGAALVAGADIAVQIVPAHPVRPARGPARSPLPGARRLALPVLGQCLPASGGHGGNRIQAGGRCRAASGAARPDCPIVEGNTMAPRMIRSSVARSLVARDADHAHAVIDHVNGSLGTVDLGHDR